MQRYYIPGATPKFVSVGEPFSDAAGTQYPANWLLLADVEELARLGAVAKPSAAAGEIVIEGADGWIVREMTSGELAAEIETARMAKKAEIEAFRDALLVGGYTHDFTGFTGTEDDGTEIEDVGSQVLQTRGADDHRNWQTLDSICTKLIAAGMGDQTTTIRTEANVNVTVTFTQAAQVLLDMALWGAGVVQKSWVVKTVLAQKTTVAEIQALDVATEYAHA